MYNFRSKKSLAASISLLTLSLFSTLLLPSAQAKENWPALLAKKPSFFEFTISPDGKWREISVGKLRGGKMRFTNSRRRLPSES